MSSKRENAAAEVGPIPKRAKVNDEGDEISQQDRHLPPSHALLGITPEDNTSVVFPRLSEGDVGISEYIDRDVPAIEGIIKQRFTDFLVFEVDLDGKTVHIKSLAMPASQAEKANPDQQTMMDAVDEDVSDTIKISHALPDGSTSVEGSTVAVQEEIHSERVGKDDEGPWPERFNASLKPFLSEDAILKLRGMFLEGPQLPTAVAQVSEGPQPETAEVISMDTDETITLVSQETPGLRQKTVSHKAGRGGRVGRGERDNNRGGRHKERREDTRRVLSEPISSKSTRTALHRVIRELFGGNLDSETDITKPGSDGGSRIAIKWSGGGKNRSGRGTERAPRGTYPPYIHFTLQKTNRDTQDALLHISRLLRVNIKDLSVAGTKDKRGVTIQRVSLKRGNKTVEDVWKMANSIGGRRTLENALKQRGERGVRVADLNYRKASLELGMLKGNAFVITLRNLKVESVETLDRAMNTIKRKGFINYYGMQRFGTATVPTHSIGLAILQSDWQKAVSLILQQRPGEHPDVVAARDAWLVDGDLDKALQLMPRRVVAERCILESYQKQKGDTRNAMGALSTIPRNLRLMYIHAYQSYVWNAIVSERIRTWGCEKPIVGDLVFDSTITVEEEDPESVSIDPADADITVENVLGAESVVEASQVPVPSSSTPSKGKPPAATTTKSRKPWSPPRVKTLAPEDLDKYTIFDVIMPLPGKDVDYPGGDLGEKYREYLRMDGLDPDHLERKQKDYSLSGSYRKILHMPTELSWSVLRYTDPDVSLAQADEDKLLGFDPPSVVEDGKFLALQIKITLGTAAYATMALREVTKTDTGSHFQTALTRASEDQQFRGAVEEPELDA